MVRYVRILVDDDDGTTQRKRVYQWRGEACVLFQWTRACSGCSDDREGAPILPRGSGCSECGYTGKRRWRYYVPLAEAGVVA